MSRKRTGKTRKKTGPLRVDRYELHEEVAAGALGRVYRATDLPTGEQVAVKLLQTHKLEDRVTVGRFLREARAARELAESVLAAGAAAGSVGASAGAGSAVGADGASLGR